MERIPQSTTTPIGKGRRVIIIYEVVHPINLTSHDPVYDTLEGESREIINCTILKEHISIDGQYL